jgi:hypothetical protein
MTLGRDMRIDSAGWGGVGWGKGVTSDSKSPQPDPPPSAIHPTQSHPNRVFSCFLTPFLFGIQDTATDEKKCIVYVCT